MSYVEFWNQVKSRKLPNANYIGVYCNTIDSLITYMAVIASARACVLLDPALSEAERLARTEVFSKNGDSFEVYLKDSEASYKVINTDLQIQEHKTSTIIFTSGSTGIAKPIELSFRNFYESALATSLHYNLKETDCWAMSLSFFHVGGLMIFYRTIFNQLSTVLLKPNDFQRHIIDYPEITILSLVELQLRKILEKESTIERAQELKGIVLGGMKTSLKTITEACSHEIYLSNTYGQTETCSQICATNFCTDIEKLQTSGRPIGTTKISLQENNQITIESNSIANGIYPKTKFNSKLLTNDIGEFNEAGRLTILGRVDDVIISGGKKISPQKITQAIYDTNLEVDFVQTCSIADPIFSNSPASIISSRNIVEESEIKNALLKKNISRFELPKFILQINNFDSLKNGIKISPKKCSALLDKISPFYQLLGQPTIKGNPQGKWLFVFHGFMGSGQDFFFLNNLLQNDYLVFYANLPGHGTSNQFQDISFSKYCDEIANELYRQNQKISVIGYSLGGRFASVLCSQLRTEVIEKLILESSGLGITGKEKEERRLKDEKLLSNIKNQNDFRDFLNEWYEQEIFSGIKESKEDFQTATSKNYELLEGFKNSLRNHGQAMMPNISPKKIRENCPSTTYIFGEKDTKYGLVANQMKEAQITTHQIKNAGHICHLKSNNEYLDLIKSILLK